MRAQVTKYLVIGVANNAIGYVLYLTLTYLGNEPKITMSLLYVVGVIIGFFGNKKLTFKHTGNAYSASLRYLIAHICGYLINLTLLIVLADRLGFAHQYVQAFGIMVVATFLFIAFRYFVFTEPVLKGSVS